MPDVMFVQILELCCLNQGLAVEVGILYKVLEVHAMELYLSQQAESMLVHNLKFFSAVLILSIKGPP